MDSIYRDQSIFEIVFRRQKESDWIVDIVEDQNGNFEFNGEDDVINGRKGINGTMTSSSGRFKLDLSSSYEATFSFIDDESNRIFMHLDKFTDNLQQIEVNASLLG